MQDIALPLSEVMFHLLFASIGTSANLRQALQSGPACLAFSSLSLAIHIIITFGGCRIIRDWTWYNNHTGKTRNRPSRLAASVEPPRMELEDVLIASNAAIGGPATAAAFCSQMNDKNNLRRLRGRTMAATFWGVFGYGIGTTIGIAMYRLIGSAPR